MKTPLQPIIYTQISDGDFYVCLKAIRSNRIDKRVQYVQVKRCVFPRSQAMLQWQRTFISMRHERRGERNKQQLIFCFVFLSSRRSNTKAHQNPTL